YLQLHAAPPPPTSPLPLHDALPICERATSAITTAQVLLAVMAAMYAVHHGPEGLTRIGRQVADRTAALAAHLVDCGEGGGAVGRSEEHTSELQSRFVLVFRLLLVKK